MTGERPIAELLRDAVQHVQELFRAEAQLAKAEVRQEVRLAASAALPLAIGALSGVSGWLLLLWAAVYGLAEVLPMWAATLIMAAATGVIAAVLLSAGVRRLKQVRAVPDRTVATMKENLAWIKPSSR
jgi:hypothetical protein